MDVGKKDPGVQDMGKEGPGLCKKVLAEQRGPCHISETSGCCRAGVTHLSAATCFPPSSQREKH